VINSAGEAANSVSFPLGNVTPVSHSSVGADNSTRRNTREEQMLASLFTKSSKTLRSPIKSTLKKSDSLNSLPSLIEREAKRSKEALLASLGDKIVELSEFIRPKHNVHYEIKKMVSAIRTIYESATNMEETVRLSQGCQTSPQVEKQSVNRETNDQDGDIETGKRKRSTPNKTVEENRKKQRDGRLPLLSNVETPQQQREPIVRDEERWRIVGKKKNRVSKRHRSKKKQILPDALLIKKSEVSFADILKKVKIDNSLNGLGEKVSQIRQTAKGDLLLELQSTGEQSQTIHFRDQLQKAIGGNVDVKTLSQESLIVIKDMDSDS
jgi:hypothetical protein